VGLGTFSLMLSTIANNLLSNFSHKARSVGPDLKELVSLLTNTYKQFARKTLQDCIKDGFPPSFLCCQNPFTQESSINADVSASEPGRNYLQATNGMGHVSFPSSYGEYTNFQIGIICNYAPDDELDENGYPILNMM
jgi:hypothetical protein